MKTDELRRTYLEYFKSKGHEIVPSDSLVPEDDPTLLFTGAGMNQFKEQYLGRNVTYTRATSCQKCLRTGDLDNVGKTSGHHTFFEMLGNFSFGDYFKKDSILWAWEFLTQVIKIDKERLWASVYKEDEEAYGIWADIIKMPKNRIVRLGTKENFWPSEAPSKGPNGPCGPCSEVFYDYGASTGCGKGDCTPACDCGRFIEIWNMVFTQFDRQPDGSLKALPSKNIDTGMGLERLASVKQGVKTNFEIDIFRPIADEIKRASKPQGIKTANVNAIADHIRAVVFTISDGVMPSNEERGYVVRKLIRRSYTYCNDLGIRLPFLYKLVSTVTEVMKDAYPELMAKRDDIAQVVKKEEESFQVVIATQLPKVEEAFEKLKNNKDAKEIAVAAFNFYDTYGMPYDMLEELAERYGLKIDEREFETLLDEQRMRSRSKSKIRGEIFTETFAKKVEALGIKTEFLGYERSRAEAKVLAVMETGEVIMDRTPFYGESGGQAGDWGTIETASGVMEVEDAKKIGETIVHIGRMLKGKIVKGEMARVSIDEAVRKKTMANHTATHLLQAALRKVLGEHVRQTGSLVDSEHLRFDFTHMKKMEQREIGRIEDLVNGYVESAMAVTKEIKDIESAKREGATALFDEKYGDRVRVVTIEGVSKELCGGTHVDNTKDVGLFKVTGESSIAAGVRRIEALTGDAAREWIKHQEAALSLKLKAQSEKEESEKVMRSKLESHISRIDSIVASARIMKDIKVISYITEDLDIGSLRVLCDKIRDREKSVLIVLATKDTEKASFVVSVTEDIVSKGVSANELAKKFAKMLDGSGGGKSNFAQGGGKKPRALEGALKEVLNF